MEATAGVEPTNGGFANRCLRPLGYVAPFASGTHQSYPDPAPILGALRRAAGEGGAPMRWARPQGPAA